MSKTNIIFIFIFIGVAILAIGFFAYKVIQSGDKGLEIEDIYTNPWAKFKI